MQYCVLSVEEAYQLEENGVLPDHRAHLHWKAAKVAEMITAQRERDSGNGIREVAPRRGTRPAITYTGSVTAPEVVTVRLGIISGGPGRSMVQWARSGKIYRRT
jgi:hypothetical protein